ncbi:MAG: helix-turn-helix domain-containing protein, partial [Rhodospirillales bacterium]
PAGRAAKDATSAAKRGRQIQPPERRKDQIMQKGRNVRTPNTIRRAATRLVVLSSARTLFVENGYTRTTVDDIARHAGISKGGIYFHFPDKADIVRELLLQTAALYRDVLALLRDSSVPPRDRLIAYMNWVAKLGDNDPDSMLLPILISLEFLETGNEAERLVAGHYEAIYAALAAALEDGRRKGVFNKRSAVREQAATIVVISDGALLEWLRRSKMLSGSRLVRILRHCVLDAIIQVPRPTDTANRGAAPATRKPARPAKPAARGRPVTVP